MTADTADYQQFDFDDAAGLEKVRLLEELVLVQSDDIGKLDVNEILLRYFESHQKQPLGVDAWSMDNQALRQLHSASARAPRLRHFPGLPRPRTPAPPVRSCGHRLGATRFSATHRQRTDLHQLRRRLRPDARTEELAERLIASGDTYADIERELASLTDQLVQRSLSNAVYSSAVHQLAVRLVHTALMRAAANLGQQQQQQQQQQLEQQQQQRLDRIAAGMADAQQRQQQH